MLEISGMDGGRDRDRTCDPFGVKEWLLSACGGTAEKDHFVCGHDVKPVRGMFRFAGLVDLRALRKLSDAKRENSRSAQYRAIVKIATEPT